MKLVIQRVSKASVSNNSKKISEIGKGLFVLVGIKDDDTEKNAEVLAEKLAKLRVMPDKEGKMNLTVNDVVGEMLIVSQFTLYADTSGGNRPSFSSHTRSGASQALLIRAARPEVARPIYEHFVEKLKSHGVKVETGEFGEYMEIETELDGPVTIILESN